jgi:hypothetical protein
MADPTVYKLTPDEAKREALGRGFAMVGSIVGLVGTGMLLSINPAVKTAAGSAFRRLPPAAQRHKALVGIALGGLVVAGISVWYSRKLRGK